MKAILSYRALAMGLVFFISPFLSGCATSSSDLHSDDSMTLKQFAQLRGMQGETAVSGHVPLWADNRLDGFSRNQANELDNMFPQFPNPTIYIYMDPHITNDGLPVPGVTTKTKMLKRDAYALPHEVIGMGL